MQVKAKLSYLRIAPRKVRLVADSIRGKRAEKAEEILNFAVKSAVAPLLKLLKSALANAKNNFGLENSDLFVSKIMVDEGPKLKRWRPRARGQAYEIMKRTSHVTLVLDTISKKEVRAKKGLAKIVGSEKREQEEKQEKKTVASRKKPMPETQKPKFEKGIRRIFRRKAF